MARVLPAAAIVVLALAPIGARAQLDSIFGPLRPPANVPNSGPGGADQQQPSNPNAGRLGAPGGVQSRPLAPLPGAPVDPSSAGTPNQSTLSALPPGQRQPARPTAPDPSPPSDATVAEPPAQKIVNKSALFSGLDKITGRIINFDVAIGETVQFGALQVTPRACYTRPPTETANTDAFVEVDEVTLQGEVKRIFTGWMFAASPGLHGVEHAIYDVWLTNCKGATQTVTATPTPDQTPPPSPPPARGQQNQQRAQQQPTAQQQQQPFQQPPQQQPQRRPTPPR
jgi:hypothetical protein